MAHITSELVSVVIPAFNAESFIQETLLSVAGQTYRPLQIIVIDDGSTDSTAETVLRCFDRMKTCEIVSYDGLSGRLITQKNQGPSAARNRGISEAAGEFIAFLDADDRWHSEKIEKQIQLMEANPDVDLCSTNAFVVRETKEGADSFNFFEKEKLDYSFLDKRCIISDPFKKLLEINFIPTSSVLAKKKCFSTTCKFNVNRCHSEDWELWLKIAIDHKLGCLSSPLVTKYEKGLGLSTQQEKMIAGRMDVIKNTIQDLGDKFPAGVTKGWLKAYLKKTYKWAGYFFLKQKKTKRAVVYLSKSLANGFDFKVFIYLVTAVILPILYIPGKINTIGDSRR